MHAYTAQKSQSLALSYGSFCLSFFFSGLFFSFFSPPFPFILPSFPSGKREGRMGGDVGCAGLVSNSLSKMTSETNGILWWSSCRFGTHTHKFLRCGAKGKMVGRILCCATAGWSVIGDWWLGLLSTPPGTPSFLPSFLPHARRNH